MEHLSKEKIKEILKTVFWDVNVTSNELYMVFNKEKKEINNIDIYKIYSRLLNSYDWYKLLNLLYKNRLEEALNDKVLEMLWPENLVKRYKYARRILFE